MDMPTCTLFLKYVCNKIGKDREKGIPKGSEIREANAAHLSH